MNPAGVRRERVEYLVNQLEEFIKAVVEANRLPRRHEDAVHLIKTREKVVNALLEESRI